MKSTQKKQVAAVAALALLTLAWKSRTGKGTVLLGPITVTTPANAPKLSTDQASAVQRFTLALQLSRSYMGADPNTLASRQPSATESAYIQGMLDLGRQLSAQTNGAVPLPTAEEQRFALAKKLPGSHLADVNAELYRLLGVDPSSTNEATVPLTTAIDTRARQLIAEWRPYSQSAVDTLFVLLDESRDLSTGGVA